MKSVAAITVGLALGLAATAHAATFATINPTGEAANISLTGLTLSSSSNVVFNYLDPSLAPLGKLAATLTLSATETGAIGFGPIALGSFDGSFALTYAGPLRTVGANTLHPGDDLLSGSFLGSVFNGYGTAGGLVDSILAGGLVAFNSNSFVSFDGLGDEGLSLGLTSLTPTVQVISGKLTPFTGVTNGAFSADGVSVNNGGVPEPAAWALMLLGFGLVGAAARRRSRPASARLLG